MEMAGSPSRAEYGQEKLGNATGAGQEAMAEQDEYE